MSYNRSIFPEGGFDYENTADLLDLPPSQAQNASLYQQLKAKQNRTPDEDTQLINLALQLQSYLITPEEINHMRNCITASQKFNYNTFTNYFKFRNDWTSNPSEPYRIFNTIRYTDGCTYMALVDFPNNPPTDNAQWLKNSAKGDKGDKGLNPRGSYDNNTDYIIDDLVYFDNSTFRNITPCKGVIPTNTGYWQPFALKGSDGTNLVIKGDYDNTVNYVINDLVKSNGIWYYAIQNTIGHMPSNTLYWKLFLAPAGTNASDIQITDIQNIYNSTNVEDALYEVKSEADSTKSKVGSTTLKTTAQNLSDAINENADKIGNLSILNTTDKSSTVNALNEVNTNFMSHKADNLYQTTGGTATAITLTISGTLVTGYPITFIASANNNGASTTINGKPLYKPGTTTAPNLINGKAYTVWYNATSNCFFIKASAEGTATTAQVLAGVPYSNENDTGLIGTMPNYAGQNVAPYSVHASGQNDGRLFFNPNDGYYTKSSVLNQWDAGYYPQNIVAGTSVFGLAGTATVASLGGKLYAEGTFTYGTSNITINLSFQPTVAVIQPVIHNDTTRTYVSINKYFSDAGGIVSTISKTVYALTSIGANSFTVTGNATSYITNGSQVYWYAYA